MDSKIRITLGEWLTPASNGLISGCACVDVGKVHVRNSKYCDNFSHLRFHLYFLKNFNSYFENLSHKPSIEPRIIDYPSHEASFVA